MSKRLLSVSILLAAMSAAPVVANAATDNVAGVHATQQSSTCKGVVIDATGEPVIGASVLVKGTTTGTITDFDGNFEIPNVSKGATLVISFVGYKSQEVVWNGQALNITLEDDSALLDEVVVTALGMKRSTKALGYSMTELKGDELSTSVVNPVSALQGKVAGVDIAAGDGGLFGSSKILIRGASTLGANNQPIYVVDGVILDNGVKAGDADWSQNDTDWGNELKNLNPDDFETVSVLKGAAATALYGSRGLNGAVVITTKSGKGKKGLGISFSQTFGVDHVYAGPTFQNKYGNGQYAGNVSLNIDPNTGDYMRWETNQFKYNSAGKPTLIGLTGRQFGAAFDPNVMIENWDYTYVPYVAKENNFTDAYDDGFNTNTNLSVQGSNDMGSFYTSLSYKKADGNTPNNTFDRLSFLAKASYKVTNKVELEAGMNFAVSRPKQGGYTNFGEQFLDGTWGRMYDSRYWRTRYKGAHGGLASTAYGDDYGYAPGSGVWWSVYENSYSQKETTMRPSFKATAELTDWLKLVGEASFNYYDKRYEAKELGSGYANEGGWYQVSMYKKEQTNLNMNLMFNKQLSEDWNVNGFLRGEYFHNFEQTMSMNTNGGLIVPGQYFIGNSKNAIGYNAAIQGTKTISSIAAQVGFSWRDQVFVDITGRNDWSSSLVYADGHGNYSYFYPSINGSWLIHETFRESLPELISFWKLRASWAQVGNDTSAYLINSAYQISTGVTNAGNTYMMSIPDTSYDANLKPERKNSWEIGTDFRVLNNRIGLDFTYYKENTTDQIMQISVPYQSGLKNQYINAGNIQNSGVEIALNTTPIQTKDWTWDLNFTYTKNTSKIVSLHENVANYIELDGMPAYGNYRIGSVAKVGGSYGLLMSDSAPKTDGLGRKVFNIDYYDYNKMHAVFYERSGEVEEVGTSQPDFLGSVNTNLSYKNWSLHVSLDGRFGGKVASYNSKYGTAYGFLETSMAYRDAENGGMTFTSIWDGRTYNDGMIPDGVFPGGSTISTPTGNYTVAAAGETYEELYKKGIVDPQHGSSWTYWNNAWSTGTLNDNWFKTLNYIALREVSVSYRVPQTFTKKFGCNSLNLTLAGRNLGYLLNSMPNNFNPESLRGTKASQFMMRSVNPYVANYTLTISATF